MTISKLLKLINEELDKKFLNKKRKRFIDYQNIKKVVLKDLKKQLNYVCVNVCEEAKIKIVDLINLDKTSIFIELYDRVFDVRFTIYYCFNGDND